jgi:glycerol-3-phosphate dehydrogenase subunit C
MRHNDVSLDNCLKCSDCDTACPMLSADPRYPGPKHLGPQLERLRREGLPCDTDWVEYCLGCHRCDLACPNQVAVTEMIAAAKARHRKPLPARLRDFWLARPARLGRLLSAAPFLTNRLLGLEPVRRAAAQAMGMSPERHLPTYARPELAAAPTAADPSDPVLFFPGCFIRYNQPALGRSVLSLLHRSGYAPAVADGGCCGVPAMANGDAAEARRRALDMVASLAPAAEAGTPIVTACTSCGHMLKTGFADLLADDPQMAESAARIAHQTYDLGELLAARADRIHFQQEGLRLAYHAPCHQLAQGIGRPWYHLLRQVPGIEIEDLDAGCCGMSGTFGFKKEKYEVSMAIGQELFNRIREVGPHLVVSECAACRMQIEQGTRIRAVHPAALLTEEDA